MPTSEELAILGQGIDDKVAPEKPEEKVVEKVEEPKVDDVINEDDDNDDEPIEEDKLEEEEQEEPKETLAPHERPSLAQIRAKYPDFLKDFPVFKDIIYREKEYTEIFPTIADAKEAGENNEAFELIRSDVFTGDGSKFLSALKQENGLERFSSKFLPTLFEIDKEAHWNAIAPVLQNVVRHFFNETDENDQNAARRLSKFLFGTAEVAEGKKNAVKEVKEEVKKVDEEESNWRNERYNDFRVNTLSNIHDSLVTDIVGDKDKLIDPDKVMSDFIKESIRDKVIVEVRKVLEKDPSHMRYMSTLWSKAEKNGYTSADKSSITSAFLARARQVVPSIRRRLVAEALGTSAKISSKKIEIVENGQARRDVGSSGRPASNGKVVVHDPKNIDYSKTSELDIINGNVTLKTKK